jgi:hypothetical protein
MHHHHPDLGSIGLGVQTDTQRSHNKQFGEELHDIFVKEGIKTSCHDTAMAEDVR